MSDYELDHNFKNTRLCNPDQNLMSFLVSLFILKSHLRLVLNIKFKMRPILSQNSIFGKDTKKTKNLERKIRKFTAVDLIFIE